MKVHELINVLKTLPQDREVFFGDGSPVIRAEQLQLCELFGEEPEEGNRHQVVCLH